MRGEVDKKGPSLAWARPARCPWRCPRECPGVGNGTSFILQLGQCEVPQGETDLPCPALAHNHLSFLARPPVTITPGREVWFLVTVAPSLTPIPSIRQRFLLSSHLPLWGLPSVPDCHIHHCCGREGRNEPHLGEGAHGMGPIPTHSVSKTSIRDAVQSSHWILFLWFVCWALPNPGTLFVTGTKYGQEPSHQSNLSSCL